MAVNLVEEQLRPIERVAKGLAAREWDFDVENAGLSERIDPDERLTQHAHEFEWSGRREIGEGNASGNVAGRINRHVVRSAALGLDNHGTTADQDLEHGQRQSDRAKVDKTVRDA